MDSPVQIPFRSFIQIRPQDTTAVYLQIVFEFIKAIQMGMLPEGTKLPGTRILCRLLSVNRNTLIKAFEDLESQGWIQILPNKGTFILSQQKSKKQPAHASIKPPSNNISFTFKQSAILENPIEISSLPYQFNDGLPDKRLTQNNVLARLYVSKLKHKKTIATWVQAQTDTHYNFKLQFCNYLNLTRGIRISTANLLITGSHSVSLYLTAKVLITPGDRVAVAAPGYYMANMTLADSGAQIIAVPTDNDGISIQHLKQTCEQTGLRALYLTAGYHYPTTAGMSGKKRMELSELAEQYGFVIIEDDYDYDFLYDNNAILPLAAINPERNIIYIGSLGRSLPAGFNYGFIAAAPEFIKELEKHQSLLEPEKDTIKEKALTEWIQEGEVHRFSKKNRKIYKERRDHFVALLDRSLSGKIKFEVPQRGLAVWVEWLDDFSLVKLQKECAMNGLFLPKITLYQTKDITATRLGFGHLNQDEMEHAVSVLSKSLKSILV